VAEFKRDPTPPRQQLQERLQSRQVLLEIRRQLEQQRPQTLAQLPGHGEELRHGLIGVPQPKPMRDLLRGFECESEFATHLLRPTLDVGQRGHAVERLVDLNGAKMLAVKGEHPIVGQLLRVELPLPRLVRVAAGACIQTHRGS
jgi:hypothetical protein